MGRNRGALEPKPPLGVEVEDNLLIVRFLAASIVGPFLTEPARLLVVANLSQSLRVFVLECN